MPFNGLGMTPGAAPSGSPVAMVRRVRVLQVDGDQRPGARIDDVQLAAVDQNALRAAQFGGHGVHAGSGEPHHPPGTRFRHQPAAVGRGHHADRVIQTRGDHLDVPVPDRQHPSRPEFGDRDGVIAGDRHAIQLIESVCQHLAFATGRSVPRHLTARSGHDEFAGS